MKRREFIKGIFIVGAASAVPSIVLSATTPDFSTSIGKVVWESEWVVDKACWIHMSSIEMKDQRWIATEYSDSEVITPEMEEVMIKALQKRWALLNS